jgi:hypothetical protein
MNAQDWFFAAILIFEVAVFYYFYSHGAGVSAVYFAWYAWIIDLLAILSGCIVMAIAVFSANTPYFFAATVPDDFVTLVFIMGSWQASIHAVKLYLRVFDHKRMKLKRAYLAKQK